MALAAIAASVAAWAGLSTWKRQSIWQSDNELARRLFLTLRGRNNAFHGLRYQLVSTGEMAAAKEDSFNPDNINDHNEAYLAAINKRILLLQEVRREMYLEVVGATASWDNTVEKASDELSIIENQVINAHMNISKYFDRASDPFENANIAFGDKEDNIGLEYSRKVQKIETLLLKKLRRQR